ncbi:hypothetical protein, partial [Oenococcus oeni]|uniref:hypothetical protein n=1 Tax=Oenococcus oeni TaxID=1247 RepID=UPI001C5B6CA1
MHKLVHKVCNLLNLKQHLHKIRDYDNLDNFQRKKFKELQELKKNHEKICIEHASYKAMYEQELKHRQLLEKKILTSEESKYDEIGLPKLNIK